MARVNLQPAFVLHGRPFRDTSLLLELFTLNYGRISAVARGARSAKSKVRGLLLPFVSLLLSWSGKSELMTITKIEPNNLSYNLFGNNLLIGLYLNELLVRLLHRHDPYPNIYREYQNILTFLQDSKQVQARLRLFEKRLLAEIGYGLQLQKDSSGEVISADSTYYYEHELGFVNCRDCQNARTTFSGESLLALARSDLTELNNDAAVLRDIKKLMRLVFATLLNGKPLKSREFFDLLPS